MVRAEDLVLDPYTVEMSLDEACLTLTLAHGDSLRERAHTKEEIVHWIDNNLLC